jgi:hypothetical protein
LNKPIAIYHEHPDWFKPLFGELQKRRVEYVTLDASRSNYDPALLTEVTKYSLVFNRMSPSAYLRGAANSILYTLGYLRHLENAGIRVVNGSSAYQYEINKGLQLQLLHSLELNYPRSVVINHPALAPDAAAGLRFPIVVKANIGGSGAGIVRFDTLEQLVYSVEYDELNLGLDSTALVQEYISPREGRITRVETLGGKYLYAINIYTTGESFNLCPADICQTTGGVELTRAACPIDAPKSGLQVERAIPPPEVIGAIERIVSAANIDVGGIEYMIDDRDGSILYYDINALSNFVADARTVIGFDPHERLVDFLLAEAVD